MPIKEQKDNITNTFIKPDLETLTYAVTEYFTRDKREKRSAIMAMTLTQLEQNDVSQYAEKLIHEAVKYDSNNIRKNVEKLKLLFYGDERETLPDIAKYFEEGKPLPLYFLQADGYTESGVRIKGVYSSNRSHYNNQLVSFPIHLNPSQSVHIWTYSYL